MQETTPTTPADPVEPTGDTPAVIADGAPLDGMIAPKLEPRPAQIVVTLAVTMTRPAYGAWTHNRAGRVVMLLATYALRLRHVQHVSIETATVDGAEIATPDGSVILHPDAGTAERSEI